MCASEATVNLDEIVLQAEEWFAANVPTGAVDNAPVRFEEVDDARAFQRAMFDAGLVGVHWPEQYGGRGLSRSHQRAIDEVARRFNAPVPFMIGIGFIGPTLLEWGSDTQRERYLPAMLRADEIWCELFSEPGAGSDLASASCAAVPDEDGWLITGHKVWTSGAHFSDFGLLLARSDPSTPRHGGLSMFILDMNQPEIDVRPLRQITGESNFNEVFIDGARVQPDQLVGALGGGWNVARTTLLHEREGIGASGGRRPGTIRTEDLMSAISEHGSEGDPWARDAIAACWTSEQVTAWLGLAMKAKAASGDTAPWGSLSKLALTALNRQAADVGASLATAHAIAWSRDVEMSPWARGVVQAPSTGIAGGTTEILKNVIAERILGLPREPVSSSTRANPNGETK